MEIITKEQAVFLKEIYLETFINTSDQKYIDTIQTLSLCSDGYCYNGYLWDFLKEKCVVSETFCNYWLQALNNGFFYVFWDNHSKDKIWIQDYRKYPKDSIIKVSWQEYCEQREYLPEDIYIFDETYEWSICMTHEWFDKGKRYCCFMPTKYVNFFKETGYVPAFNT